MELNDSDKVEILNIFLDKVDYDDALDRVRDFLKAKETKIIVTPNAEIIMDAQKDSNYREIINSADMVLPDGIGVVLAAKILGNPLKTRTTGFDMMIKILQEANKNHNSIYLLGGKPGVADKAADKIKTKLSSIDIVGTSHGYFSEVEEENIVEKINKASPDFLFVAMGAPKQEFFMAKHKTRLGCKVAMGVGGSLDVISGNVKRAPVFMQKAGLEWLYRLIKQPSRIKRIGALPKFLIKVLITGRKH